MKWTNEELAYMAGLIDGEGSVSIELQRANGKQRKHDYYSVRLTVFNTNIDVMHWLKKTFEGNFYQGTKYPGRKACYTWKIFGNNMLTIINACYPYFIIKKQHADVIIEFRKTVLGKTCWNIPKEILEQRRIMYLKSKALNKTGDHTTSPLLPVS